MKRIRTRSYTYPKRTAGTCSITETTLSSGSSSTRSEDVSELNLGFTSSVITDEVDVKKTVKDVVHDVVDYKIERCELGSWFTRNGGHSNVATGPYTMWDIRSYRGKMFSHTPFPDIGRAQISYPKTEETLLHEAYEDFKSPNDVDTLLNVLEAQQTIDSVRNVYNFISQFFNPKASLVARKGKGLSRFSVNPLDLSNMYLSWSFGFAPLIADCRKIVDSIPKLRKNLKDLALRSYRSHSVVRSSQGNLSYDTNNWEGHGDWWVGKLMPVHLPIRRAGVRGKRTIQFESDAFKVADYLMARFFATSPASLAWEKVPFSFVCDWFVDISSVLARLDDMTGFTGDKAEAAWTSEGYKFYYAVIKQPSRDPDGELVTTPYDNSVVAQSLIQHYHRKSVDYIPSVIASGRFGKKQASLTAALLHQQVANLKRHR